MVTRYFIYMSFKGTAYHGWQFQPNAISVQQVVENALSTILNDKISVTGAGRTDAEYTPLLLRPFRLLPKRSERKHSFPWQIERFSAI